MVRACGEILKVFHHHLKFFDGHRSPYPDSPKGAEYSQVTGRVVETSSYDRCLFVVSEIPTTMNSPEKGLGMSRDMTQDLREDRQAFTELFDSLVGRPKGLS